MPGQPLLYATSRSFMDYFGLNTSDDLPRIKEIISTEMSEPTLINDLQFPTEFTDQSPSDNISEASANNNDLGTE
jgi:segregation and condensation protein B